MSDSFAPSFRNSTLLPETTNRTITTPHLPSSQTSSIVNQTNTLSPWQTNQELHQSEDLLSQSGQLLSNRNTGSKEHSIASYIYHTSRDGLIQNNSKRQSINQNSNQHQPSLLEPQNNLLTPSTHEHLHQQAQPNPINIPSSDLLQSVNRGKAKSKVNIKRNENMKFNKPATISTKLFEGDFPSPSRNTSMTRPLESNTQLDEGGGFISPLMTGMTQIGGGTHSMLTSVTRRKDSTLLNKIHPDPSQQQQRQLLASKQLSAFSQPMKSVEEEEHTYSSIDNFTKQNASNRKNSHTNSLAALNTSIERNNLKTAESRPSTILNFLKRHFSRLQDTTEKKPVNSKINPLPFSNISTPNMTTIQNQQQITPFAINSVQQIGGGMMSSQHMGNANSLTGSIMSIQTNSQSQSNPATAQQLTAPTASWNFVKILTKVKKFIDSIKTANLYQSFYKINQTHLSLISDKSDFTNLNQDSSTSSSKKSTNKHKQNEGSLIKTLSAPFYYCFRILPTCEISASIEKLLNQIPLFLPHQPLLIWFRVATFIISIITSVFVPLMWSFDLTIELGSLLFYLLFCVPFIVFVTEILLSLNTAFYEEGDIQIHRKNIIIQYAKSMFILDLVSTVAFYFLFVHQKPIFTYFVLFRLLKLTTYRREINEYFYIQQRSNTMYTLVNLILTVMVVAHYFACGFNYVAVIEESNSQSSWIISLEIDPNDWASRYINSIYFSFITMVTVGFGDIKPTTDSEKIYVTLVALISSLIFAYTVNTIGTVFQEIAQQEAENKSQKYHLSVYMRSRSINQRLQTRAMKYLDHMIHKQLESPEKGQEVLKKMSKQIRDEINKDFFGKILSDSKIFKFNFSEAFLQDLTITMKEIICRPGETIFSANELDNRIFFINKGDVELFLEKSSKKADHQDFYSYDILTQGDIFGELSFFTSRLRETSAKSLSVSHIVYCTFEDFVAVLKSFPKDYEKFCQMKDEVMNYGEQFNTRCAVCQKFRHSIVDCPYIHMKTRKSNVIHRHIRSVPNERNEHERRGKKTKIRTFLCILDTRGKLRQLRREYTRQSSSSKGENNNNPQEIQSETDAKETSIIQSIRLETSAEMRKLSDHKFFMTTPKIYFDEESEQILAQNEEDDEFPLDTSFQENGLEDEYESNQLNQIDEDEHSDSDEQDDDDDEEDDDSDYDEVNQVEDSDQEESDESDGGAAGNQLDSREQTNSSDSNNDNSSDSPMKQISDFIISDSTMRDKFNFENSNDSHNPNETDEKSALVKKKQPTLVFSTTNVPSQSNLNRTSNTPKQQQQQQQQQLQQPSSNENDESTPNVRTPNRVLNRQMLGRKIESSPNIQSSNVTEKSSFSRQLTQKNKGDSKSRHTNQIIDLEDDNKKNIDSLKHIQDACQQNGQTSIQEVSLCSVGETESIKTTNKSKQEKQSGVLTKESQYKNQNKLAFKNSAFQLKITDLLSKRKFKEQENQEEIQTFLSLEPLEPADDDDDEVFTETKTIKEERDSLRRSPDSTSKQMFKKRKEEPNLARISSKQIDSPMSTGKSKSQAIQKKKQYEGTDFTSMSHDAASNPKRADMSLKPKKSAVFSPTQEPQTRKNTKRKPTIKLRSPKNFSSFLEPNENETSNNCQIHKKGRLHSSIITSQRQQSPQNMESTSTTIKQQTPVSPADDDQTQRSPNLIRNRQKKSTTFIAPSRSPQEPVISLTIPTAGPPQKKHVTLIIDEPQSKNNHQNQASSYSHHQSPSKQYSNFSSAAATHQHLTPPQIPPKITLSGGQHLSLATPTIKINSHTPRNESPAIKQFPAAAGSPKSSTADPSNFTNYLALRRMPSVSKYSQQQQQPQLQSQQQQQQQLQTQQPSQFLQAPTQPNYQQFKRASSQFQFPFHSPLSMQPQNPQQQQQQQLLLQQPNYLSLGAAGIPSSPRSSLLSPFQSPFLGNNYLNSGGDSNNTNSHHQYDEINMQLYNSNQQQQQQSQLQNQQNNNTINLFAIQNSGDYYLNARSLFQYDFDRMKEYTNYFPHNNCNVVCRDKKKILNRKNYFLNKKNGGSGSKNFLPKAGGNQSTFASPKPINPSLFLSLNMMNNRTGGNPGSKLFQTLLQASKQNLQNAGNSSNALPSVSPSLSNKNPTDQTDKPKTRMRKITEQLIMNKTETIRERAKSHQRMKSSAAQALEIDSPQLIPQTPEQKPQESQNQHQLTINSDINNRISIFKAVVSESETGSPESSRKQSSEAMKVEPLLLSRAEEKPLLNSSSTEEQKTPNQIPNPKSKGSLTVLTQQIITQKISIESSAHPSITIIPVNPIQPHQQQSIHQTQNYQPMS